MKMRKLIKFKKNKMELINKMRIKKIMKEINKSRVKIILRRLTMRRKIKGVIMGMKKIIITKVIRRV